MPLLADYTFSPVLRYEAHRLIYTPAGDEPLELGGFFGAAFLAALLTATDEGDARGIDLQSEEQQSAFFARYEREVLHDDWGYLQAELNQLRDSYVQFSLANIPLTALCHNNRLLDLAIGLNVRYMQKLVTETFCEHIWEVKPWTDPFPQWLWDAARIETRRQRFLQTDWTDPVTVTALADRPIEGEEPTFLFAGENAADIMERYLSWLTAKYEEQLNEQPTRKINLSRHRKFIVAQETDYAFLSDEIGTIDDSLRAQWQEWMTSWDTFIRARFGLSREVLFWANDVTDTQKEHLLYRLRMQERQPNHFRELTTTVYAMRHEQIIRRGCSLAHIKRWLSLNLDIDYTERNNSSQFNRAWKEHGRYTPEIIAEVEYLRTIMG